MKKFVILFIITFSFAFDNPKVENLMGSGNFNTYNKLLSKIFTINDTDVYDIVKKLKNNGLLDLFFDKAKIIDTKFSFINDNNILNSKILNDSLKSLGYYYFYVSEVEYKNNKLNLNIECKSEHYIDPVSLIDDMKIRGCEVLDLNRSDDGNFNYKFDCSNGIIKEAHILDDNNQRYINASGVYWIENNITNPYAKIEIKTKKLDYWHPSVWFYDKELNLLNNIKLNKKTTLLTLKIPAGCKYIKITDIYSVENFKRGIIVKGLK